LGVKKNQVPGIMKGKLATLLAGKAPTPPRMANAQPLLTDPWIDCSCCELPPSEACFYHFAFIQNSRYVVELSSGLLRFSISCEVMTWVASLLPSTAHQAYAYDTDHSIQAVDVETKISKAGSGLDPSSKSLPAPLSATQ